MNNLLQNKDFIVIDEEKYYHYSFFGKYKSTKFVVINGIHYYNQPKVSLSELELELQ